MSVENTQEGVTVEIKGNTKITTKELKAFLGGPGWNHIVTILKNVRTHIAEEILGFEDSMLDDDAIISKIRVDKARIRQINWLIHALPNRIVDTKEEELTVEELASLNTTDGDIEIWDADELFVDHD